MNDADKGAKRRRDILGCIETYTRMFGHPPSHSEIAKAIGLKHRSGVLPHLIILRRAKKLTWTEGQARSIKILL